MYELTNKYVNGVWVQRHENIFRNHSKRKKHYHKVFRCCETTALRFKKQAIFRDPGIVRIELLQSINPSSSTKKQVAITYLACNVIKSFARRNQ